MRKISKVLAIALAAMMFVAIFAGCNKEEATTTTATTSAAPTTTPTVEERTTIGTQPSAMSTTTTAQEEKDANAHKYGGTVIMAYAGTPNSWLLYTAGNTQECQLRALVTASLVRTVEKSAVELELADWYEVSEDQCSVTYHISDNAYWHDGTPITADDYMFSWDYIANDVWGSGSHDEDDTSTIEKIDEKTLKLTNEYPLLTPVSGLEPGYCLPKHIYENIPVDQTMASEVNFPPILNGPFKVVEEVVDEYVRLAAHEQWVSGRPYLDEIILRQSVGDVQVSVALATGEVDFINVSAKDLETVSSTEGVNVQSMYSNQLLYLCFNCEDPVLSDVNVRKALCHCFDRDGIRQQFFVGRPAVEGFIDYTHRYYTEGNAITFEYDLEKAAKILDDAGWVMGSDGIRVKDGQRLTCDVITGASGSTDNLMAVYFAAEAAKVGAEIVVKMLESSSKFDAMQAGDFGIGYNGSSMGDPIAWVTRMFVAGSQYNLCHYTNDELWDLSEKANKSLDDNERKEIMLECERMLTGDAVSIFIAGGISHFGIADHVHTEEAGLYSSNAYRWYRPEYIWTELKER